MIARCCVEGRHFVFLTTDSNDTCFSAAMRTGAEAKNGDRGELAHGRISSRKDTASYFPRHAFQSFSVAFTILEAATCSHLAGRLSRSRRIFLAARGVPK